MIISGVSRASGIIACSSDSTGIQVPATSCYTNALPTFNVNLQWNSLTATDPNAPVVFQPSPGQTTGGLYNTTWDLNTSFLNLTVQGSSMITAENYGNYVWVPGQSGFKNAAFVQYK